jgi:hypothetical protein
MCEPCAARPGLLARLIGRLRMSDAQARLIASIRFPCC